MSSAVFKEPEPAARQGGWLAGLRFVLATLAGAALFAMMALTFLDVVGRKVLNHSIIGSVELTELMMLALIFCAMPVVSLAGGHVIFDLLDAVLSERLKRWQASVANLICTVLLAVAGWFVLNRAMRTHEMGDITAQLAIPLAPFHYSAAILLMLCAVMHLYLAISGKFKG